MVMVMRRVVMRRKSGGRMMRTDERRANSDQRILIDRRTMKGRPSRRWLINTLLTCCYDGCSSEAV